MSDELAMFATLWGYSDWSNRTLIAAASRLSDEQLDRTLDIGRGSVRVNLLHTLAGESVWLRRWREEPGVPWPSEQERSSAAEVLASFEVTWRERDAFFAALAPVATYRLAREQVYRDSKGSMYAATLRDMLIQALMHSKHHQAQTVNMLRRVGGEVPELDYMYRMRRAAHQNA
jgi:uncharacterized damage-inducible protein DinB